MSKKNQNNESTINIIYLFVKANTKKSGGSYGAIINTDGVLKKQKGSLYNTNSYNLGIQAATKLLNLLPKGSIVSLVSDMPYLNGFKSVPKWEKHGWFRYTDGKPIPKSSHEVWRALYKATSRHGAVELIKSNPSTQKNMMDAEKLI